jgi:integrase
VITLHATRHSFYSNHRAAGESPSTVSRMLGHTSEVFSQTRYRHLTDDAGDSPLPLSGSA